MTGTDTNTQTRYLQMSSFFDAILFALQLDIILAATIAVMVLVARASAVESLWDKLLAAACCGGAIGGLSIVPAVIGSALGWCTTQSVL